MTKKIKCMISLSIPIILPLVILLIIVCDESKNEGSNKSKVTISDSTYLEKTNYENKLKFQIEYLSQTNVSLESLLDRKENAAWAAFALYLTGLLYFFFSQIPKLKDFNCYKKSFISIQLIVIAIIAFAFIHAQYSSIYETYARAYASNELISKIIDSGEPRDNMAVEQDELYNTGLKKGQKYRRHLHPLQICWQFICLDWTKSGARNINSTNTQEASIYLIMLLFNAIIIVQIFNLKPNE